MKMTKAELAAHKKERVLTQRIRAMAVRQGYVLVKIRRVDRLALDYGTYQLWDGEQIVNEAGKRLDDIEAYLLSGPRKAQQGKGKGGVK
jgi:hypothetical protein